MADMADLPKCERCGGDPLKGTLESFYCIKCLKCSNGVFAPSAQHVERLWRLAMNADVRRDAGCRLCGHQQKLHCPHCGDICSFDSALEETDG